MTRPRAALLAVALLVGCGEKAPSAHAVSAAPAPSWFVHLSSPRPRPDCKRLVRERMQAAVLDGGVSGGGASLSATPPLADADEVVAALRPKFRACYQAGLRTDRTMEGCVVARAVVDVDGHVATAEPFVSEGLSPAVVDCIVDAVHAATFGAPSTSKKVTLHVPVTFVLRTPPR